MTTPLLSGYTITGDALPERLQPQDAPAPAFSLPGADALAAFADLLGGQTEPEQDEDTMPCGAPFPLPALLPEDAPGCVTLTREVDFGEYTGDQAWIDFDMLCGYGEIVLQSLPPRFPRRGMTGPEPITLRTAFRGGPLTLDVTKALLSRRRFSLSLCFEDMRPAGVCGAIALRIAQGAAIRSLLPEPAVETRTVTLHVTLSAAQTGEYLLHAQGIPAHAPAPQDTLPLHERPLQLTAGEMRTIRLSLSVPGDAFVPGKSYASPAVKLWLCRKSDKQNHPVLCDSLAQPFGYPGSAPACFLPLSSEDCSRPPELLAQQLLAMQIPAVSLKAAAPDLFYRTMTRSGVAVRQAHSLPAETALRIRAHACVSFGPAFSPDAPEDTDLSVSAWRLCGLTTCPRPVEPGFLPVQLLGEAAGRALDPAAPSVLEVLRWLRAFSIRLHAEAMRCGKTSGALCAPGEWTQDDAADALRTALSPLHLSALPLYGAWWAGSHFSAALRAFIPEGQFPQGTLLRAEASLEDAQGGILAKHIAACPAAGGPIGLISAVLPEESCVLELITRLYADSEIVEETSQPVYVGVRGALEAAFAACAEDHVC